MVGTALERELPIEQLSDAYRVRLFRGAAGRPLVGVLKPYAEDERRAYSQQVLRTTYQNSTPPLDENAVYLQSYTGMTATDSQLALHHELRRTHPHLTLYWGINDHSTLLPEGAVGVMMLSPRVVRRPGPREVPRLQRGLPALVRPQARAEGAADLPRLPGQVDGDPAVAGEELHRPAGSSPSSTGRCATGT